ncbi:hypothetical protein KRMM14A1259_50390 [Krasilnikovia sp. MM14-A1259]
MRSASRIAISASVAGCHSDTSTSPFAANAGHLNAYNLQGQGAITMGGRTETTNSGVTRHERCSWHESESPIHVAHGSAVTTLREQAAKRQARPPGTGRAAYWKRCCALRSVS